MARAAARERLRETYGLAGDWVAADVLERDRDRRGRGVVGRDGYRVGRDARDAHARGTDVDDDAARGAGLAVRRGRRERARADRARVLRAERGEVGNSAREVPGEVEH